MLEVVIKEVSKEYKTQEDQKTTDILSSLNSNGYGNYVVGLTTSEDKVFLGRVFKVSISLISSLECRLLNSYVIKKVIINKDSEIIDLIVK